MKALSQLKKNPPANFETQSKADEIKLKKYPGNPFSPHLRNQILVWASLLPVNATHVKQIVQVQRELKRTLLINSGGHGSKKGKSPQSENFGEGIFIAEDVQICIDSQDTAAIHIVSPGSPCLFPGYVDVLISWCYGYQEIAHKDKERSAGTDGQEDQEELKITYTEPQDLETSKEEQALSQAADSMILAEVPDNLTELCDNFFEKIPDIKKKFEELQQNDPNVDLSKFTEWFDILIKTNEPVLILVEKNNDVTFPTLDKLRDQLLELHKSHQEPEFLIWIQSIESFSADQERGLWSGILGAVGVVVGVGLVLAFPEALIGVGMAACVNSCASGAAIVGGVGAGIGEIIDSERTLIDWKTALTEKQQKNIKTFYQKADADQEKIDKIPRLVKAEKDVVIAFIEEVILLKNSSTQKVDYSVLTDEQKEEIQQLHEMADDSEDINDIPNVVQADKDVVMAFIEDVVKVQQPEEKKSNCEPASHPEPIVETISKPVVETKKITIDWKQGDDAMPKHDVLLDNTMLISEARKQIFRLQKKNGLNEDFKFIKESKALTEAMEKKKDLQFIINEDENDNKSISIFSQPKPSVINKFSKQLSKVDGFQQLLYSREPTNMEKQNAKVLIVIGGTGSGKTTLLNTLVCYCLGVKKSDQFRYRIVDDSKSDQTQSVTNSVTEYYVEEVDGRSPPLLIIDTPGFGDTRGPQQDKIIFDQIKELFMDKIEQLHAICFVGKSPSPRLDHHQEYILQNIVKLFGKDCVENFVTMATFCDGGQVLIKNALEASDFFEPILKSDKGHVLYPFNNSAVFVDPTKVAPELHDQFWAMGMNSMQKFIEEFLNKAVPKSLQQTRQNLQKRQQIEEHVISIKQNQKLLTLQKQELDNQVEFFKKFEREINDNKDFTYEETKWKGVEEKAPEGTLVTHCMKCVQTCHKSCKFDNGDKWRCYLFRDSQGEYLTSEEQAFPCKKCKCRLKDHSNTGTIWKQVQYLEPVTLNGKKGAFDSAQSGKSRCDALIDEKQKQIGLLRFQDLGLHKEIEESMEILGKIAMKKDVYSGGIKYYESLIELEKNKTQTQEVIANIKQLEEQKENSEMLAKASKIVINASAFHNISKHLNQKNVNIEKEFKKMEAEKTYDLTFLQKVKKQFFGN